jgi:hypothetical protein
MNFFLSSLSKISPDGRTENNKFIDCDPIKCRRISQIYPFAIAWSFIINFGCFEGGKMFVGTRAAKSQI